MSWFKSSYSAPGNDNCVECRIASREGVHVRDSKHRDGPTLAFAAGEWRAFVSGVRDGEFDSR